MERRDIFISYADKDLAWAEWIGWHLEEAGFRVTLQYWETVPERDWMANIDEGIRTTDHMVVVASAAYLGSPRTRVHRLAAWPDHVSGPSMKIIPILVEDTELIGPLRGHIGIRIVGRHEEADRAELLGRIGDILHGQARPNERPPIPLGERAVPDKPAFPTLLVPSPLGAPAGEPGAATAHPAPPSPTSMDASASTPAPGLSSSRTRVLLATSAVAAALIAATAIFVTTRDDGGTDRGAITSSAVVSDSSSRITPSSLLDQVMGPWEHHSQLEGIEYTTVDITLEINTKTFRQTSELYSYSGPSGQRTGVRLICDGTVTANVDEITLRVESTKRQPIGDATNLEYYSCANSIIGKLVDSGRTLELIQPRGGPIIQLRRS